MGSTTVKAVVLSPEGQETLWECYERHNGKQAEKVLEFLLRFEGCFIEKRKTLPSICAFMTGSGAGPIAKAIGAKFVQEVNAVTFAVERFHPDAGSVIELGGQDAKIIIFKESSDGSQKKAISSMNDKCASGTGATIDKCLIKVGLDEGKVSKIRFDETKLHHVAAKCGVFAETDIVNLVKQGIPAEEILCSLANAIVSQNLSVLTRGNTLRRNVVLLGGPNSFLPFLVDCWRLRIPETWDERGYDYPKEMSVEEIITVPEGSLYYAAQGAALYGISEGLDEARYKGLDAMERFVESGRENRLSKSSGPALAKSHQEIDSFLKSYSPPKFVAPEYRQGDVVRGVVGLDGGSTSSKVVLIDEEGNILRKVYQLSQGNPIQDAKELFAKLSESVINQGASLEVTGFGVTGYAGDVLEKALLADANIVETVAHMNSAMHYFGDVDVICDVGGQDIKVLFTKHGKLRSFKLSNQCSAGNGMLLQAMASQFGVPVTEYAEHAFKAKLSPIFNYGCAVFLDSDRVNFQKEGYSKEELMCGLAQVLPKNIWQYIVQAPRLAQFGTSFILQGGTQKNLAALKAQVDYIKERVPDARVNLHPHTGEAGAIGAALEALRVVKREGMSTFVGLEDAMRIEFETRNDETTRCTFCANNCSRSFIDTETPMGQQARHISGNSCDSGTVEDKESLVALVKRKRLNAKSNPNLVALEAKRCFGDWFTPERLPEAGIRIADYKTRRSLFGAGKTKRFYRSFERSALDSEERRKNTVIGIPKILNLWSVGPFFTAYFETIGLSARNIVFSDDSGEEMFAEGGKYGSIDPCYPAKVGQAHIHNLLFKKHPKKSIDHIYFPAVTHMPTYLQNVMDSTACPIVSGSPKVLRAAFTKEIDFFAREGIEYVDEALTFSETNLLKDQLYETWSERLDITRDENDFAVEEGFRALREFDAHLEEQGKAILEDAERENRMVILMVGRPYHNDVGINHRLLEEFQSLGYPILSMRSIPKDLNWLKRFFQFEDCQALDVSDVWPENYSSNSAQKVWAVKFACRHPNVAIVDLSSFKCGHDAPTYGIIESMVDTADAPYLAIHDIDANQPSGSFNIRLKTFDYTLRRMEEEMEEEKSSSKNRNLEVVL